MRARAASVVASVRGLNGAAADGRAAFGVPDHVTPYWLSLPVWLDQAWRQASPREALTRSEIADLLWAQYALFLHVRLLDDLLDGHRTDLRLLPVADRFLLESLGGFQQFPPLDGAFWMFYRSCLRETVDGLLEARELEAEPGRFTTERLDLHARVSAIFQLGTGALCWLYGRRGELAWLSALFHRLAVFSQICDDLQDLAPDVAAGRFTWVASTALQARAGQPLDPDQCARRVGEGLLRPEGTAAVVSALRETAGAAIRIVPESAPRRVRDLVRSLAQRIDAIEQDLHETAVRWVFGERVFRRSSTRRPTQFP
jgi:hypothetical protein